MGRYGSQEYGKAKLIQVSSRTSSWGGFDAFVWMEEQANREMARAEALKGLESGGKDTEAEDLEKKYSAGGNVSVDSAMEGLKREIQGA